MSVCEKTPFHRPVLVMVGHPPVDGGHMGSAGGLLNIGVVGMTMALLMAGNVVRGAHPTRSIDPSQYVADYAPTPPFGGFAASLNPITEGPIDGAIDASQQDPVIQVFLKQKFVPTSKRED